MTDVYVWSECGKRPTMEDTHIIEPNFMKTDTDDVNVSLYAIFDGHAGNVVSVFLHDHFSATLKKLLKPFSIENVPKALDEAFYQCNENLKLSMKERFIVEGGSTAVVALIIENNFLFVANCGDAEAIVYSKNLQKKDREVVKNTLYWSRKQQKLIQNDSNTKLLTKKHKPYYDCEWARVVNAGGFVYRKRVGGMLAISRAFGDFDVSDCESVVIADPYISSVVLSQNDIVILACDGLWDVYSYSEAVQDALQHLDNSKTNIARLLVNNAINERKSDDNVSVIVIQNGSAEPTIIDQSTNYVLKCFACRKKLSPIYFSKNQTRKGSARRCKSCIDDFINKDQ